MSEPAVRDTEREEPFDIDRVLQSIGVAIQPFPQAALFELADRGFRSPFEQLLACILSIRTLDEVSLPAALHLFALARTPEEVSRLQVEQIDAAIGACTFHERKAEQIHRIAETVVREHGGALPCDAETMQGFSGVGPKCANLALGIACGQARIGVDIHVHRVTNRWGYVATPTPEKTILALEAKLPRRFWVEINRLLVPFGKHICTGRLPRCSTCPVRPMCAQVGVTRHR